MIMVAAALAATAAPQQLTPAQAGSQLVVAVQNCRALQADAARLACYDRSVSALAEANARGDVKVIDRGQMREVRRSLFGFAMPRLPFFSNSKDRDVQAEPKELVTTLASFSDLGNGFFRFTIAEPQSTWETTEGSSLTQPKSGAKVTLQRGAMGSYFAEIGGQQWVRARRVR